MALVGSSPSERRRLMGRLAALLSWARGLSIRYLRRKVGDDRIQTVRGVGYRIVEPAHA